MSNFYPIDHDTSIQKLKLVYKSSPDVILEYLYLGLTSIIALGAPSFLAIISYKSALDILQTILCLLWDAFIISNLILFRSLVKVEGNPKRDNKKDIIKILSKSYQLQNEHIMHDEMIRDISINPFTRWGRVITCLFNDNCIYLNVTTVFKRDSFSCFNGLLNYIQCRDMAKEFQKIQSLPEQNSKEV